MTEDQRQRADEFVRRLRVYVPDVELVEEHNAYRLKRPQGTRFGSVRYNIGNSHGHAGMYTVCAYPQFDDPEGRFINTNRSSRDWYYFFSPGDEDAVTYAVRVLKSACDRREPRQPEPRQPMN